jgi:hypothetical protein
MGNSGGIAGELGCEYCTSETGMKTNRQYFAHNRRRQTGSNLAEFGPALILFFAFILGIALPFLRFGVAAATLTLFADRACESAAKAPTYGSSLICANQAMTELVSSPIGRLAGLKIDSFEPITLYIQTENCATGASQIVGPNLPLARLDENKAIAYEYQLRTRYLLEPMLPEGVLPWWPHIPLLGTPVIFPTQSTHAVEYPDGLTVL